MIKKQGLNLIISSICIFAPLLANAQTVVRETSNGDLMVIEFRGKPPHKRRFISPDNVELFARYSSMLNSVMVASESTARSGPPGKMTTLDPIMLERIPASDISQFSRFEESEESTEDNTRAVRRGPPGKSRPFSNR